MLPLTYSLRIASMPLWQGVSLAPAVAFHPFSLGIDDFGVVRQTTPPDILSRIIASYAGDTYRFITSPPGASAWGNAMAAETIAYLLECAPDLDGARVLDIGGGTTYVAEKLVERFDIARYTVVDPAVRDTPRSPRISLVREYFTEESFPDGAFDLVVSMNCLEHVPNPENFLCRIRQVLKKDGGKAVLFFPDTERQFRTGDFNALLHEHITYFTRETVLALSARAGLEAIDIRSEGDVFKCLFQASTPKMEPADLDPRPFLEACAAFERSLEYFTLLTDNLLRSGSRIAFHGACNGLGILLALSGLSESDHAREIVIFDGDHAKHGRYLHNLPNPILDPALPSYKDFDRVIVAAMTYFEPIQQYLIRRHGIERDRILPIVPPRGTRPA